MNNIEIFLKSCGVVDVESTSPEPQNCEIIELAFGKYANDDWTTKDYFYNPGIEIPPESAEKHFITDEQVKDKPSFSVSYDEHKFGEYVQEMRYLVAHNAQYDRTAIVENYNRRGVTYDQKLADKDQWICTYQLAKKVFSGELTLPAYRLGVLWFYFKLYQRCTRTIIPHQADSDIYMCGRLLEFLVSAMIELQLIDDTKEIGPQIIEFIKKPVIVTHWPFGKHKGELVETVPHSYLKWSMLNIDMLNEKHANYDNDLTVTVKAILGI